jgi:hypothetical protein
MILQNFFHRIKIESSRLGFKVRLLALTTLIRLDKKCLTMANTLAYQPMLFIIGIKVYSTG